MDFRNIVMEIVTHLPHVCDQRSAALTVLCASRTEAFAIPGGQLQGRAKHVSRCNVVYRNRSSGKPRRKWK